MIVNKFLIQFNIFNLFVFIIKIIIMKNLNNLLINASFENLKICYNSVKIKIKIYQFLTIYIFIILKDLLKNI